MTADDERDEDYPGTAPNARRRSALLVAEGLARRIVDLEAAPERDEARIAALRRRARHLVAEYGEREAQP